jgi:hypothetical protein
MHLLVLRFSLQFGLRAKTGSKRFRDVLVSSSSAGRRAKAGEPQGTEQWSEGRLVRIRDQEAGKQDIVEWGKVGDRDSGFIFPSL